MTDSWMKMYGYACEYYNSFGNLDVPINYVTSDGIKLGQWINNQRIRNRVNVSIDADGVDLLNKIGMIWDLRIYRWFLRFNIIKSYYIEHGSLKDLDSKDVSWLRNQRLAYKNMFLADSDKIYGVGVLNDEQVLCLQSIGFSLDGSIWKKNFLYAKAYYMEYGNLNVPRDFVNSDGFGLGRWITGLRNSFYNNELSEEKILLLESIGMIWNLREFKFVTGTFTDYKRISLQGRLMDFLEEYLDYKFDSYDDVLMFERIFFDSIGDSDNHYRKR